MTKLKKLELNNVYGYQKAVFDFTDQKLGMFYGQNGCGKSTLLDVIRILAAPWRHSGRNMNMFFRKMAFHEDYNPNYQNFQPFEGLMSATAVFDTDGKEEKVELEYDSEKVAMIEQGYMDFTQSGIINNELKRREIEFEGGFYTPMDYSFFPEADKPTETSRFQIPSECKDAFLDIARTVYGYDCWLVNEVEEKDRQRNKMISFFSDFIIYKDFEGTKVHYRSMSAGERKIATLLSMILNPVTRALYDIYLIDNITMHVYYTRHVDMLKKIQEHLPEKQIFATTHSGELIRHLGDTDCLYDVVGIKKGLNNVG